MVYKGIKKIEFGDIERFANIYGFPEEESIKDVLYNINGGKPIGFCFGVETSDGSIKEDTIDCILSFNEDDDQNIYDAMEIMADQEDGVFPIALDENENYICYVMGKDSSSIKLYDADEMVFYDIYNDNGEIYDPYLFMDDLDC